MKTARPTTIHIGLPKTATTCFQSHLFTHHPQIHYFGKYADDSVPEFVRPAFAAKFCATKIFPSGDIREADIPTQLTYAAENNLTPVLSKEGLSGGEPNRKQQQAELFKRVFGECRIILFLREPVSFCKSWYAEMLKAFQTRPRTNHPDWAGNFPPAPHYFTPDEWINACWERKCSPQHFFSYADTAEIYANVFGRENIRFFVFEEFQKKPEGFIEKLCTYLHVDAQAGIELLDGKRANDRITTDYVEQIKKIGASRLRKFFFQRSGQESQLKQLSPKQLSGEKFNPEFSAEWLNKINEVAREQNRRITRDWKLPLADYGYQL